jgi:ribonuclease P protein component
MPTFPHSAKLSQPSHYQRVFGNPAYKVSNHAFLLLAIPTPAHSSRIGIIVAKKHIRRATRRNRIKRLIREQFRLKPFLTSLDLVILARPAADRLDNPSVRRELDTLWQQLEQKAAP